MVVPPGHNEETSGITWRVWPRSVKKGEEDPSTGRKDHIIGRTDRMVVKRGHSAERRDGGGSFGRDDRRGGSYGREERRGGSFGTRRDRDDAY